MADSVSLTAPSSPTTATVPAASMRPAPWNQVILFFLNRNSTPLVVASTTSALRFMHWARSSVDVADLDAVHGKIVTGLLERCEDCSSALDGMQPTLRQVPPQRRALLDAPPP